MQFDSAKELLEFAEERQKFGCELTLPVRVRCVDGIVAIFPGTVLQNSTVRVL